jgi:hypothetical protein
MLPLPSHVAVIQEFPHHSIVKELQELLGMVNFYRRFLPSIAKLWLLMDEMRSSKKGLEQLEILNTSQKEWRICKENILL